MRLPYLGSFQKFVEEPKSGLAPQPRCSIQADQWNKANQFLRPEPGAPCDTSAILPARLRRPGWLLSPGGACLCPTFGSVRLSVYLSVSHNVCVYVCICLHVCVCVGGVGVCLLTSKVNICVCSFVYACTDFVLGHVMGYHVFNLGKSSAFHVCVCTARCLFAWFAIHCMHKLWLVLIVCDDV